MAHPVMGMVFPTWPYIPAATQFRFPNQANTSSPRKSGREHLH